LEEKVVPIFVDTVLVGRDIFPLKIFEFDKVKEQKNVYLVY
jgi:hypothetical protein